MRRGSQPRRRIALVSRGDTAASFLVMPNRRSAAAQRPSSITPSRFGRRLRCRMPVIFLR